MVRAQLKSRLGGTAWTKRNQGRREKSPMPPSWAYGPWPAALPTVLRLLRSASIRLRPVRIVRKRCAIRPLKRSPAAAGAKESAQEELDQDEQRRLDEISEQKAHFPVPRTFVSCNKGLKVTFVPRLAHPDMYSGLAWIRNRCGGRALRSMGHRTT